MIDFCLVFCDQTGAFCEEESRGTIEPGQSEKFPGLEYVKQPLQTLTPKTSHVIRAFIQ